MFHTIQKNGSNPCVWCATIAVKWENMNNLENWNVQKYAINNDFYPIIMKLESDAKKMSKSFLLLHKFGTG